MTTVQQRDPRLSWQRRLQPLLRPASWLYAGVQAVRRSAYRRGLIPTTPVTVPVISVGSLLAGGAGKTPFVAHLAGMLEDKRIAVLSRGYGGRTVALHQVDADADPGEVGDEAVLLARQIPCDVWVARDRAEAARRMAPDYDLVILDDGYQHLMLRRDLNICLVPDLPFDAVLPAGLWRERPGALADADLVIGVDKLPSWLPRYWSGPTALVTFVPGGWQSDAGDGSPTGNVLSFCGIARPERFFESLSDLNVVEQVAFPDHHAYSPGELEELSARARDLGVDGLVTTAKDAVRLGTWSPGPTLFWREVTVRWTFGQDVLDVALERVGVCP